MGVLLEKAIAELRKLSEAEQEAYAQRILDVLADEAKWEELFANSREKLAAAGKQGKHDIAAGLADELDPNRL